MKRNQAVYNIGFDDGLYGCGETHRGHIEDCPFSQHAIGDYEDGYADGEQKRLDGLADQSYSECFE